MKMRGRGSEHWIRQRHLAAPDRISCIAESARRLRRRNQIRIDDDAAGAIAEISPAVGFAENTARGQLSCPKFLIVPENVALRIVAFCEKAVYEADGFDGFAVIDGAGLDARFLLELFENRFGKNLILGCINDDDLRRAFAAAD